MTKIEWTEETWNPVTGCTKVSQGCKNCYAETFYERFHGKGTFKNVICHENRLDIPLKWKSPKMIFVNSMSDLFHEDVPFEFIDRVFAMMALCPQHTFQVLTKRHQRMVTYFSRFESDYHQKVILQQAAKPWTLEYSSISIPLKNVWLGISVENQEMMEERMEAFTQVEAEVKFLSCEPLLGPVALPIDANDGSSFIDWVICGGESGHGARPMHPDWVRALRDQCNAAGVAFFFKQWGEYLPKCQINEDVVKLCAPAKAKQFPSPHNPDKLNTYYRLGKSKAGRLLDGIEWNEFPIAVTV